MTRIIYSLVLVLSLTCSLWGQTPWLSQKPKAEREKLLLAVADSLLKHDPLLLEMQLPPYDSVVFWSGFWPEYKDEIGRNRELIGNDLKYCIKPIIIAYTLSFYSQKPLDSEAGRRIQAQSNPCLYKLSIDNQGKPIMFSESWSGWDTRRVYQKDRVFLPERPAKNDTLPTPVLIWYPACSW